MAKVRLGLKEKTREQKITQANTIKTSMTGNANFTTPNPSLAAYGTLITTAQTKLNAYDVAKSALATALAECDAAFGALDGGTTQLSTYAENVTNGDRVKLESGGFDVRGDGAPVGPLTQVLNLVLTAGDNEGTLDAAWDSLRGANSYEIHISVDPVSGTSWTFKAVAGKSSITLDGLTSGAKMWVRVRGIGAGNSKGPWSDPAVKTVP